MLQRQHIYREQRKAVCSISINSTPQRVEPRHVKLLERGHLLADVR